MNAIEKALRGPISDFESCFKKLKVGQLYRTDMVPSGHTGVRSVKVYRCTAKDAETGTLILEHLNGDEHLHAVPHNNMRSWVLSSDGGHDYRNIVYTRELCYVKKKDIAAVREKAALLRADLQVYEDYLAVLERVL